MFALAELSARDTVSGAEPTDSLSAAQRADSLRYVLIERYPDSEFAAVARRILGLAAVESRSDTSGRMYAEAEALYLSGRNEEAIAGFQEVIDRFPASNDAARSQFAMGFIYENHLGLNDSAEVHYRSLAKSFPRTTYASAVQPKLFEVDQARKEAEAARRRDSVQAAKSRDSLAAALKAQDSLGMLQKAPADTLNAAQGKAAVTGKDTLNVPPPAVVPPTGTPPDTTAPPPGEPPESEPPQDQPETEPPPDEEPPPSPPDITRPGYR
jgi:tetratricopeptide (TPR) repeat protein